MRHILRKSVSLILCAFLAFSSTMQTAALAFGEDVLFEETAVNVTLPEGTTLYNGGLEQWQPGDKIPDGFSMGDVASSKDAEDYVQGGCSLKIELEPKQTVNLEQWNMPVPAGRDLDYMVYAKASAEGAILNCQANVNKDVGVATDDTDHWIQNNESAIGMAWEAHQATVVATDDMKCITSVFTVSNSTDSPVTVWLDALSLTPQPAVEIPPVEVTLPADTVLANGGLEQWDTAETYPWEFGLNVTGAKDSADYVEGTCSLKITVQPQVSATLAQYNTPVPSGQKMDYIAYAKADKAGANLIFRGTLNKDINTTIDDGTAVQSSTSAIGMSWEKHEAEITGTDGTVRVTSEFVISNPTDEVITVWLDAVSLVPQGKEPTDPVDKVTLPDGTILRNGGMEDWNDARTKPLEFGVSRDGTRDTDSCVEGTSSLKLDIPLDEPYQRILVDQYSVPVTANTEYDYQVYAKSSSSDVRLVWQATMKKADGSNSDDKQKLIQAAEEKNLAAQWTSYRSQIETPDDAAYIVIEIMAFNNSGSEQSVWLDAVSLVPREPEEGAKVELPQDTILADGGLETWAPDDSRPAEFSLSPAPVSSGKETADVIEGNSSLKMVLDPGQNIGLSQWWRAVAPQGKYQFITYVKADKAGLKLTQAGTMYKEAVNGSFTDDDVKVQSVVTDISTEWTEHASILNIPSDTYFVTPEIYVYNPTGEQVTVYLDAISIAPYRGRAILQNGGFEEMRDATHYKYWDNFNLSGGAETKADTTTMHSGTQSLNIVLPSDTALFQLGQWWIPVDEQYAYEAEGWYKQENQNAQIELRFTFYDSNSVHTGTRSVYPKASGDEWYTYMETVVPPEGSALVTIEVIANGAEGSIWVDDIAVREVAKPEMPTLDEGWHSVDLGIADLDASVTATAFAEGVDGRHYIYIAAYTSSREGVCRVGVLDVDSASMVATYELPESSGSWGLCMGADGKMYVGTIDTAGRNGALLYRLDPKDLSAQPELLGNIPNGQMYAWQIAPGKNAAGDDGIYGGTYPGGQLFFYNIDKGQFETIANQQPFPKCEYLRAVEATDEGYIYCGFGTLEAALGIYDTKTGKWLETADGDMNFLPEEYRVEGFVMNANYIDGKVLIYIESNGRDPMYLQYNPAAVQEDPIEIWYNYGNRPVELDGTVYCASGSDILQVDAASGEGVTLVKDVFDGVETWFSGIGGHKDADGNAILYGYSNLGYFFRYDTGTGEKLVGKETLEGYGQGIMSLHGMGDKIYIGPYMTGNLIEYDKLTGTFTNYGRPVNTCAEIYSFADYNGKLFMGSYTQASFTVYDPTRPFAPGSGENDNPRYIGNLDPSQYRPTSSVVVGDKLYVVSLPAYGYTYGALSVIDLQTYEITMLWHIPETMTEGFNAVSYSNGKIYMGSDRGNVYVYDLASGTAVKLDQISGGNIQTIISHPERNEVYIGSITGKLYLLNSTTDEIEKEINLVQSIWALALDEAADRLYVLCSDLFGVVTLDTDEFFRLADEGVGASGTNSFYQCIYLDEHGDIYYGSGTNLKMFTTRDIKPGNVVSVENPAAIYVPYGTAQNEIDLPGTVAVTLDNGEKINASVVWSCGNYNGNAAGEYRFEGKLILPSGITNSENLTAGVVVVVENSYLPPIIPTDPTYPVNIPNTDNGFVTISPKHPRVGDAVTITVVPDAGYELKDIYVTDPNGNLIAIRDNSDGTYTFAMPGCTVKINVSFTDDSKIPPVNFADVDENDWFYDYIQYAAGNGLMAGVGGNIFDPNGTTTRAMIWTILARISGEEVSGGSPWYAEAQSWSVQSGVSDGTDPNGFITREQLAAMLYRYAGSPAVGVSELAQLSQFPDEGDVSGWASDAMAWAVGSGLISGIDGRLSPRDSATRAQVAAILMRYCESVVK